MELAGNLTVMTCISHVNLISMELGKTYEE